MLLFCTSPPILLKHLLANSYPFVSNFTGVLGTGEAMDFKIVASVSTVIEPWLVLTSLFGSKFSGLFWKVSEEMGLVLVRDADLGRINMLRISFCNSSTTK